MIFKIVQNMTTNLFESWLLIYQHSYKSFANIVSNILFDNFIV